MSVASAFHANKGHKDGEIHPIDNPTTTFHGRSYEVICDVAHYTYAHKTYLLSYGLLMGMVHFSLFGDLSTSASIALHNSLLFTFAFAGTVFGARLTKKITGPLLASALSACMESYALPKWLKPESNATLLLVGCFAVGILQMVNYRDDMAEQSRELGNLKRDFSTRR